MSLTTQSARSVSLPAFPAASPRSSATPAAAAKPEAPAPVDAPLPLKLRMFLKERLVGAELDLCNLSTEEHLSVDEWRALQRGAISAGREIAFVKCEGDALPELLEGVELLPDVECLSVSAPPLGGELDFGTLGRGGEVRCWISGSPNAPLTVTACGGLRIEGMETRCVAIQQSVVHTRLPDGSVTTDSIPLHVAPILMAAPAFESMPAELPRLATTPLLVTLTHMLDAVASEPALGEDPVESSSVAKAFLDCAAFDEQGDFGFDLKKLTAQQVRCIQALPAAAWNEVQNEVEEAGWLVTWLDIHQDFALGALARALQPLSPLSRITVSAPKGRGFFIDLAGLHGPELANWHNKYAAFSQLQEVAVRPRTDKPFVISVPHSLHGEPVKVVLAKDAQANSAHLQKSSILRVDIDGRTVGQAERFLAS